MKRARSIFLSLSAVILLGTVVLWVGTRGTRYYWATNSLAGRLSLAVYVGGGLIAFQFEDPKRSLGFPLPKEGFALFPLDEADRTFLDEERAFEWTSAGRGMVMVYGHCPTWFPGTLLGGVLLGWGLLCRRDGEGKSEGKEAR